MAFCQSIIALVVHLGLIDGSGNCGPPHEDRKSELTTMERAFQLAETSTCTSISDIKTRLRAEGYEGDQIDGPSLKRQLRALIKARHA
jgi:hypothetical protein